jgi:glycosyltransferase involved in cell wall biosynthesis
MKIVVVTNIPNPYRVPLFNELNRQMLAKNWKLKVVFAAQTYSRRKFILDPADCLFDHEILGSGKVTIGGDNEKTAFTYSGLLKTLRREDPECIIVSGFSLATLKVWWYTRFNRSEYIIWSGSIAGKGISFLRTLQRRFLAAFASGAVVYGKRAGKYVNSLGIDSDSIATAINTVDTSFFRNKTSGLKENGVDKENKHRLSYVGYLSERKQVDRLLECIRLLADEREDFIFDLIGDGDAKASLEEKVKELKLEKFVQFSGFLQKEELPEYYARTDVFLFQTGFDIWGLVLNEAMASGLPCIVSPNAGASDDLVIENETGFVIDFNETKRAVEKIKFLFDHKDEAERIGKNAAAFIENNAGLIQSAEGFVKAILFSNKNRK